MVYNQFLKYKYGYLNIVATDRYVTNIEFEKESGLDNGNDITKLAAEQIDNFLNLKQSKLDFPIKQVASNYQSKCYDAVSKTKLGQLLSYKELATLTNNPNASRAVGTAMSTNNIPIIVPCHRVIKTDGTIGQFGGGIEVKKYLQEIEWEYLLLERKKKVYFNQQQIDKLTKHPTLGKMFNKMEIVDHVDIYIDPFQCLISQILYQQIAFRTAKSAELKLNYLLGFDYKPEDILTLTGKNLKFIGISIAKYKYLINITKFYINNQQLFNNINKEQLNSELLKVKGIGPWTIEMFNLFYLNDQNVLSLKDLIIVNGLKELYNVDELTDELLTKLYKEIKGIETLVSMNLWKYIEQEYYLNGE